MQVGVMVGSYNHRDWDRLLAGEYNRPPTKSDVEIIDGTISIGDMVEPLGFDSILTTEHYGSAYSMGSNPLQWLAFWAGRTERIDVGTAVIVAPWWQPVKLAHEIAMLDNLLQGRKINIGIGRGIAAHEYAAYGIPREESRARFREMIEILRGFDENEFFEYHGQYYDVPLSSIRPQARHKGQLFGNMLGAFNTPASMEQAAELGLGQLFVAQETLEQMSTMVGKFNAIRQSKGLEPNQPSTMLYLHCATDPEEIEKGHHYAMQQGWAARNHYAVWNNPGQFENVKGYEDYAKFFSQNTDATEDTGIQVAQSSELIGTPEQIYNKIQEIQEKTSLNYLIVHPIHGEKTPEEAKASLKLFAEEVLPAVHKMETPLHEHNRGSADLLNADIGVGGAAGR